VDTVSSGASTLRLRAKPDVDFRHIVQTGLLNSHQLKLVALFFMTLDHFGAYQTFTTNNTVNDALRLVGRIAAPLFLFLLVQGLHHTRSKEKYILRLYVAGVLIAIANELFMTFIAPGRPSSFGNILFTFMYTALYITLIERLINTIQFADRKRTIIVTAMMLVPFIFVWLRYYNLEHLGNINALRIVLATLAPSLFSVEYSVLFVLLGIAWYFINNRYWNIALFFGLCLLSFFVPGSLFYQNPPQWLNPVHFNVSELFILTQWGMVLAIPFIFLYNGERGGGSKYFFYFYYPLHQYLLFGLLLLGITPLASSSNTDPGGGSMLVPPITVPIAPPSTDSPGGWIVND